MAAITESRPFHPAWLAGMLECAGSVELGENEDKERGNVYYRPRIRIGDNSRERMLSLQTIVGGNIYRKGNTWLWVVNGKKALEIAERIKQFTLKRQSILLAFQNWENSDDRDERSEIVQAFEKESDTNQIPPQEYTPLITNPYFLAGVVDARGIFTYFRKFYGEGEKAHDIVTPFLQIISENVSLLDSIAINYKGKSSKHNRSWTWRGNSSESQRLVGVVAQYLLLRPNEVWK